MRPAEDDDRGRRRAGRRRRRARRRSSTGEPQEAVAAGAVGGGPFVLGDDAQTGVGERVVELARRSGGSRGTRRRARACGRAATSGAAERPPARGRPRPRARGSGRTPRRRARARGRTRSRYERTTARRGQVLEDEVADERVGDPVVDAVEPLARTRAGSWTFGAVTFARACSSIAGETSSATTWSKRSASAPVIRPGPAADLDAGPAAGVAAEPSEQPRELLRAAGRVADVHRGLAGGQGVPRAAHLQPRQRVSRGPGGTPAGTVPACPYSRLRDTAQGCH